MESSHSLPEGKGKKERMREEESGRWNRKGGKDTLVDLGLSDVPKGAESHGDTHAFFKLNT